MSAIGSPDTVKRILANATAFAGQAALASLPASSGKLRIVESSIARTHARQKLVKKLPTIFTRSLVRSSAAFFMSANNVTSRLATIMA